MALSKYLRIPQYEVKQYPVEQLEKVQQLFSRSFGGRSLSLEMLKWQMDRNPCLQRRATSLWQNDTLVAYNALTPHPAILNGEEVISAVSGTSMADTHFMGSSIQLFTECAKQNNDIALIYGFPNHNSFGITVKYVKHHYVGDVAFWIAKAERKNVTDKIQSFFSFSNEYEKISRDLSKTHIFVKTRKREFLNWRFFQKPGYDYKGFEYIDIKRRGYIVVDVYEENGMKQLQVVDLIADSLDVLYELLNYAINLAFVWHCSIVKLWLTSDFYKAVLEDSGFEYGEHPFPMTCWTQDLDIAKSYITMEDSDIF